MKVNLFRGSGSAARAPKPGQAPRQSIRGKISGPIPIPNPLDDEDFPIRKPGTSFVAPKAPSDDEFPIRRPGYSTAAAPAPPGGDGSEEPEPQEAGSSQAVLQPAPPHPAARVSAGRAEVGQSSSSAAAAEPPASSGTQRQPGGPSPTSGGGGGSPRSHHRTNPSSTLRYSQLSAASTGGTGASGARPERKKSTLRNALSRLFGRMKKGAAGSQGGSASERGSGLMASGLLQSDPAALDQSKDGEPKRSASLPVTEYDRALRSHSVGPDDMTAIESARNSLQGEPSPVSRRRAATTTSRLFFPHTRNKGDFASDWTGLSPRPASAQGRGSSRPLSLTLAPDDDPNTIGRAITSDEHSSSNNGTRRRSRSLSGIGDLGAPQPRRRSDEIRYWRESYDPTGPAAGLASPGLSSARDHDDGEDDTGAVSVSVPDSPTGGGGDRDRAPRPPKTPPQPFVFGSIASMNEMAGMKITHAASIDSRIGGLEARMWKLERVVEQLCHAVPGFRAPLSEFAPTTPGTGADFSTPRSMPEAPLAYFTAQAPPRIPAAYQAMAAGSRAGGSSHSHDPYGGGGDGGDTDAHSHMSFGEGQTYIGSLHPPSSAATQPGSIPAPAPAPPTALAPASTTSSISPALRPTSTSTVRGATSLPALGSTAADEPRAALAAQLEAERAARAGLEAQLLKLSDRVNALSSTLFAVVGGGGPAAKKARSTERLGGSAGTATPPTPVLVARRGEGGGGGEGRTRPRVLVEAGAGEGEGADELLTPGEGEGEYSAFGEGGEEDAGEGGAPAVHAAGEEDPKRRKAARTMSLSQLTLGKGAQVQI